MKKIFIYLKACVTRGIDASKVREYLLKNNYEIVDKPKKADAIIIFVCMAGDDKAKEASIKSIEWLQKYNTDLIITGCLPNEGLNFFPKNDNIKTVPNKELDKKIEQLFPPKNNINFSNMVGVNICFRNSIEDINIFTIKNYLTKLRLFEKIYLKLEHHLLSNFWGENSEIYKYLSTKKDELHHILICHGCRGNCSYCAVKKTIGELKSEPLNQCIDEFKKGLKKGNKDFIICAEDTGAYGLDINSSFPELLDIITDIPGDYRISIEDVNPRWIIKYADDLEKILKKGKIYEIGVPIESASSRILKLMYRDSNVEKMKNSFYRIKKAYPSLKINTHYILGFPSETWDEFLQTLNLIIEMKIDIGLIFPFYCKPGTDAEKMEPKVSDKEMMKRLKYSKKFFKKAEYNVYQRKKFFIFEKKQK